MNKLSFERKQRILLKLAENPRPRTAASEIARMVATAKPLGGAELTPAERKIVTSRSQWRDESSQERHREGTRRGSKLRQAVAELRGGGGFHDVQRQSSRPQTQSRRIDYSF